VRVTEHLEGLGIDGKIILNYSYNKYDGGSMDCSSSGQGQLAGC
jgi:hypothetical protein